MDIDGCIHYSLSSWLRQRNWVEKASEKMGKKFFSWNVRNLEVILDANFPSPRILFFTTHYSFLSSYINLVLIFLLHSRRISFLCCNYDNFIHIIFFPLLIFLYFLLLPLRYWFGEKRFSMFLLFGTFTLMNKLFISQLSSSWSYPESVISVWAIGAIDFRKEKVGKFVLLF